jgi:hypothetical protein
MGPKLTVDDLVVSLFRLDVAGDTGASVAAATSLAWIVRGGVGRVGGVEPQHVGIVLNARSVVSKSK